MITCRPQGFLASGFFLEGDGWRAALNIRWLTEQGSIQLGDQDFETRKHGPMSGHWSLKLGGKEYASGKKPSPFTRTVVISSPMGELRLVAETIFTRGFQLEASGKVIARMQPNHVFTRHAKIKLESADMDLPTLCFAFWLVLISWRRSHGA